MIGWTETSLADECEIILGQSPPSSSYNETGDGLPFYQGMADFGDIYPKLRKWCDEPTKTAIKDDVLMSVRAPVGPVNMAAVRCCIGRGVAAIRPSASILPKFLFYYLLNEEKSIASKGTGSTFQAITGRDLRSHPLRYPRDIATQQAIVEILDQADTLRRKRREANALHDRIVPALFRRMFNSSLGDWPSQRIDTIIATGRNKIRTGPFGSQLLHSEFTKSGTPVLGIDNVVASRFQWGKPRHISKEKLAELSRYQVFPRDVLITIMGTCGRCVVVPDNIPTAINSKHLCCITLDQDKCDPWYFQGCILHDLNVQTSLGASATGAVMPGLNMEKIKSTEIKIPPIEIQRKYATNVQDYEMMFAARSDSSAQLETLFQTLLTRAFDGRLVSETAAVRNTQSEMNELFQEIEIKSK